MGGESLKGKVSGVSVREAFPLIHRNNAALHKS